MHTVDSPRTSQQLAIQGSRTRTGKNDNNSKHLPEKQRVRDRRRHGLQAEHPRRAPPQQLQHAAGREAARLPGPLEDVVAQGRGDADGHITAVTAAIAATAAEGCRSGRWGGYGEPSRESGGSRGPTGVRGEARRRGREPGEQGGADSRIRRRKTRAHLIRDKKQNDEHVRPRGWGGREGTAHRAGRT